MTFDFEWKDNYAVGVPEIDSQHKRFLDLIGQIHDLKGTIDYAEKLQLLIEELEKYLVFHTKSEEMLMTLYSYPRKDEQKLEHAKIIEEIQSRIENLPQSTDELASMLLYLMKWFINHTTYLDKDLGKFINTKRNQGAK